MFPESWVQWQTRCEQTNMYSRYLGNKHCFIRTKFLKIHKVVLENLHELLVHTDVTKREGDENVLGFNRVHSTIIESPQLSTPFIAQDT